MIDTILATYIFIGLTSFVILFQFALVFGALWSEMAMGGKYPRRLPLAIRMVELV